MTHLVGTLCEWWCRGQNADVLRHGGRTRPGAADLVGCGRDPHAQSGSTDGNLLFFFFLHFVPSMCQVPAASAARPRQLRLMPPAPAPPSAADGMEDFVGEALGPETSSPF